MDHMSKRLLIRVAVFLVKLKVETLEKIGLEMDGSKFKMSYMQRKISIRIYINQIPSMGHIAIK